MAIKANIGIPKLKKTKQFELSDDQSKALFGKKIGEKIKGELIDMQGYEFEVTGGSDKSGFPMRKDVALAGKKKVLITKSLGNRNTRKGMRLRKTVAGNTIFEGTVQVNLKVLKEGKTPLIEEVKEEPKGEEAPAEEKKEE